MDLNSVKTQFDVIAKKYDEGRRCLIPCFDDFYTRSLEILKELMPTVKKIADLGAGTGLLSMELFQLYPDAKFLLIDISEEMIDVAKQRFNGIANVSFIIDDYIDNIPMDWI